MPKAEAWHFAAERTKHRWNSSRVAQGSDAEDRETAGAREIHIIIIWNRTLHKSVVRKVVRLNVAASKYGAAAHDRQTARYDYPISARPSKGGSRKAGGSGNCPRRRLRPYAVYTAKEAKVMLVRLPRIFNICLASPSKDGARKARGPAPGSQSGASPVGCRGSLPPQEGKETRFASAARYGA